MNIVKVFRRTCDRSSSWQTMFRGNGIKWILKKQNIRVWTQFIWLRKANSAGLLWIKILGSIKCRVSLLPLCNTICELHPGCHGHHYYCSLWGTCWCRKNSWVLGTVTIINKSVLCEACIEAEETVQHQAYGTT